jgi:hypothetical protein
VGEANRRIEKIARERSIPVVDLFTLSQFLVEEPLFCGVRLTAEGKADQGGLYIEDGFHPMTVVNGMLAAVYVEAFNRAYDAKLKPITGRERFVPVAAALPSRNNAGKPPASRAGHRRSWHGTCLGAKLLRGSWLG